MMESDRESESKKKRRKFSNGDLEYVGNEIMKDTALFVIITVVAFLYTAGMLLIISFVTMSYLHFTIGGILITSIVVTVLVDILYIVKLARKHAKNNGD